MVSWRWRNVLLYPIVTYFDIEGCGGIRISSMLILSPFPFFSSNLLRFLLRFPFEGVMYVVLCWPMGSRRLNRS